MLGQYYAIFKVMIIHYRRIQCLKKHLLDNQENNACNSSPYLGLTVTHTWLWMTGWWGSWRWRVGHWTHTPSLWWICRTRPLSLSEVVGTFEYTLIKSSDTLDSLLPEPKICVIAVFRLQKANIIMLYLKYHIHSKSPRTSELLLLRQSWVPRHGSLQLLNKLINQLIN